MMSAAGLIKPASIQISFSSCHSSRVISLIPAESSIPPIQRRGTSEVSTLRSEGANITQRLDTSQEKLHRPVGSSGCVPRKLMTGELDLVERQSALVAPGAQISSACQSTAVVFWVVGRVERGVRVGLETAKAIPLVFVSFCRLKRETHFLRSCSG